MEIDENGNIFFNVFSDSPENLRKDLGAKNMPNSFDKNYFICHTDSKEKHNPALAICKKCEKAEEINPTVFSKIFNRKNNFKTHTDRKNFEK